VLAGGVWAPERRALTVGLVLAVTLVAFEALAVATVLPVVSRQLGDLRLYGWVFSAFLLSSLVGIVVAGTLADRLPLSRPMLAGLLLFATGLVIGGLAPDMPVLVAGRAVQGLGAGVVPATAYVAISRGYPDAVRPRMFAVLSSAWVIPGLIGPAIAALAASAAGWRVVFLGLLPLVAVAGILATIALHGVAQVASDVGPVAPAGAVGPAGGQVASDVGPVAPAGAVGPAGGQGAPAGSQVAPGADQVAPGGDQAASRRIPVLAVAGLVAGAALALGALSSGSGLLIAPGVVAGGAVLALSLRRLTPPGTLALRAGLPSAIGSRGLLTFAFYAGDAYVPYAITGVRHAPTLVAGAALTASTMAWCGFAWVQARAIARVGPRRLVRVGEVLLLVALLLMAVTLLPAVPPACAIAAWSVAGAGMGLAYAPLSLTTLDLAPPGQVGMMTSGLQLTDVLGQALGTGAGGAAVALGSHGLGLSRGTALAFAIGIAVGVGALCAGRQLPTRLSDGT
jgi:MFS family permease